MPIGPEIVFTVAGVLAVIYLVQEFRTWWKGNKKNVGCNLSFMERKSL